MNTRVNSASGKHFTNGHQTYSVIALVIIFIGCVTHKALDLRNPITVYKYIYIYIYIYDLGYVPQKRRLNLDKLKPVKCALVLYALSSIFHPANLVVFQSHWCSGVSLHDIG